MKAPIPISIVICLFLIFDPGVSWSATITVDTTRQAVGWDLHCSLIEAIENANADAAEHSDCAAGDGSDTIELAVTDVYTLDRAYSSEYGPTGLPTITGDLTINGNGAVIERRRGSGPFRLLAVAPGASVLIRDLGIHNGRLDAPFRGGGLLNLRGSLTLDNCRVTGNVVEYRCGGIANLSGNVTLIGSFVTENSAGKDAGGVCNLVTLGDATIIVLRSSLNGNESGRDGGGLYNAGDARFGAWAYLREAVIAGNRAAGAGGGVLQRVAGEAAERRSSLTVDASTIRGNSAEGSGGGGIAAFGSSGLSTASRVEIRNSRIVGNESSFGGGVEAADGVELAISVSSIADNRARDGSGGGVLIRHGSRLDLRRSTVSGNRSADVRQAPNRGHEAAGVGGGAIAVVDGTAAVGLSTISGNVATGGDGGAIWISTHPERWQSGVEVSISASTVVHNRADGLGGALAASVTGDGGTMSMTLQGSIVADNGDLRGFRGCFVTDPSDIVSLGNNLADDDSCGLATSTDLIVDDVMLWPLEDNGGLTLTHMPKVGSPAVDSIGQGTSSSCIDQRGFPRVVDGDDDGECRCDRGAVEARSEPMTSPHGREDVAETDLGSTGD